MCLRHRNLIVVDSLGLRRALIGREHEIRTVDFLRANIIRRLDAYIAELVE